MSATIRAHAPIADAQSAATANPTLAIPSSAVIGDVVFVTLNAGGTGTTLTTPSGWTLKSGPNVFSGQQQWCLVKKLVSGDPGSTVTFALSASVRCNGLATIVQDGTDTGLLFVEASDTGGGSTTVTPSIPSVPAGSVYLVHFTWARATASPAPDITVASPYSQAAGSRTATNYGNSPEFSNEAAYEAATTAGTYGGDTLSTVNAGVGWNYAIAVPPAAAFTGSLAVTGSGSLSLSGVPDPVNALAVSGSGTPSFAGIVVGAPLARTGSGSLSLSGVPINTVAQSGSGSLSFSGLPKPANALAATGSGAVSFTVKPIFAALLARTGTGSLSLVGLIGGVLARTGSGTVVFAGHGIFRHNGWTGLAWVGLTPEVWSGAAWLTIPVVIAPSDVYE